MIDGPATPPGAPQGGDPGIPPDDAKERVKAATLAVFCHFAGPPRSRPSPQQGTEGRYTFDCPACGSARKLSVVIFEDGRPPGYGRGGCGSPSCRVPKSGDALDFVKAFLSRGKKTPPPFDEVIAAALHAARLAHDPGAPGWADAAEKSGADQPTLSEPPPSAISGSLGMPSDTNDQGNPDAAAGAADASSPPALFDVPDASPEVPASDRRAHNRDGGQAGGRKSRPAPGGGRSHAQPALLAEPDEAKADLAARAAVYEELLRLCPPDERFLEDLKALGISGDLARRESFGAFYPARASEVIAALQLKLGAARLLAAPGFAAEGRGPVTFELEGAADDALYALVPYRDPRARVIALEALSLSGTRGFGSHRLLGCPPDGRDPHLGGAHHLWYPGDPLRLQAITDDLLEGMRAASAGVRCAATRGPESFDPGAGNEAVPGLRDVAFGGGRVLYAPSPSARAREAAPRAARALISRRGGAALVLRASFEEGSGLGSYLLSHLPEERTRAFALLASEPNADVLPAEVAAPRPTPNAASERRAENGPPVVETSPFEAESEKAPPKPARRKGPAPADLLAGVAAGAIVFLAALAPLFALAGPARLVLEGTASALEAASATGEPASFPLDEPIRWIPHLVGRALGSWADPAAAALWDLAAGGELVAVCLAAISLAAACAGFTVTGVRQRHARKRIKMMEGRLKEW